MALDGKSLIPVRGCMVVWNQAVKFSGIVWFAMRRSGVLSPLCYTLRINHTRQSLACHFLPSLTRH